MSAGQLEIKLFMVPGWNSTSGSKRKFPGHTRVNHTKYIVTDMYAKGVQGMKAEDAVKWAEAELKKIYES